MPKYATSMPGYANYISLQKNEVGTLYLLPQESNQIAIWFDSCGKKV